MSDVNSFVFPSKMHPRQGYTWYRNGYDNPMHTKDSNLSLSEHVSVWDNCGDGMVQHSPDSQVRSMLFFDCLYSLGQHLLEWPAYIPCVAKGWPKHTDAELVTFVIGLSYNEKKRQYYNLSERKVSTSSSKEHDKRWERLHDHIDGTLPPIMGMLCQAKGWTCWLERFAIALQVMNSTQRFCFRYDVLKFFNDLDKDHAVYLHQSYEGIDDLVQGYRLQDLGKRRLDCVMRNAESLIAQHLEA